MKKTFVAILISFTLFFTGVAFGHTDSDTINPMEQMMQDNMAGPGAMTMMMPQIMQNAGFLGPWGITGLGNSGNGTYWITVILVWAVLVLAIIALIKWLTKKNESINI